jgi:hypothetical protein
MVMDFSEALDKVKSGRKIARTGWNGRGMFLYLVPGSMFSVNKAPLLGIYPAGTTVTYRPHIDLVTADGQSVPWVASQTDLLEDDWVVVN